MSSKNQTSSSETTSVASWVDSTVLPPPVEDKTLTNASTILSQTACSIPQMEAAPSIQITGFSIPTYPATIAASTVARTEFGSVYPYTTASTAPSDSSILPFTLTPYTITPSVYFAPSTTMTMATGASYNAQPLPRTPLVQQFPIPPMVPLASPPAAPSPTPFMAPMPMAPSAMFTQAPPAHVYHPPQPLPIPQHTFAPEYGIPQPWVIHNSNHGGRFPNGPYEYAQAGSAGDYDPTASWNSSCTTCANRRRKKHHLKKRHIAAIAVGVGLLALAL